MSKRLTLALLAVVIPMGASAQIFQPGRLAASRDSFDVIYQGQSIGAFVMNLERTGDNYTFSTQALLPRMGVLETDSLVFNATSLAPSLITNQQSMMGMSATSRIAFANGKATGTIQRATPGGVQNRAVDTAIAPGTIIDGTEIPLLSTVDFSQDLTLTFQTFDPKMGRVKPYELKVLGKESVTVPAGTFDAWKLQLTSNETVLVWVSASDPKKIVLLRQEAAQMEMRRAR
jgi:hypothetical protein